MLCMSGFQLQSIAPVPNTNDFVHVHWLVVTQAGKVDIIIFFILQMRKLMLGEAVTWLNSPRGLVAHLVAETKARDF